MWLGLGIRITNWWRSVLSGPFNGHATLTNGLVSAWPLSEDGFDVHGTNDLTNNNTVTFVAKGVGAPANMPGTVANFVAASSQSLSRADTAVWPVSSGDSSVTIWVKMTSALAGIVGQYADGSAAGTLLLTIAGAACYAIAPGDFFTPDNVINDDTWRLVILSYNATTGEGRSYVNGDSGLLSFTRSPAQIGEPWGTHLRLGAYGGFLVNYLDGQLSSAMIWSRVLTAQERTDLYNSGAGLFY